MSLPRISFCFQRPPTLPCCHLLGTLLFPTVSTGKRQSHRKMMHSWETKSVDSPERVFDHQICRYLLICYSPAPSPTQFLATCFFPETLDTSFKQVTNILLCSSFPAEEPWEKLQEPSDREVPSVRNFIADLPISPSGFRSSSHSAT